MESAETSLLDSVTGCSLLHEGGEAWVYRVERQGRRDVILKWYKPQAHFDEGVVSKIARSPVDGVYRVLEWGNREGTPYVLYEYVDGVVSAELGVLPVAGALMALRQLVRTLSALDCDGVHHGDLSPSNVLLTRDGQTVLIDFGIVGPGAYAYAAPERFRGRSSDVHSDMYSLGLLLFRWISGTDLVESDVSPFAELHPTDRLYGMGKLSPQELSALEPLWSGLLQNDPDRRFEDLDELDEVLEIALYKIGGGEIALQKKRLEFSRMIEKMRQNVPESPEMPQNARLPYHIVPQTGKKFPVKLSVLLALVLILLVMGFVLFLGTRSPDIDDVASMVLENSRSLELKDIQTPKVNP